jgi:FG-GAP-like repeat
MVAWRKTVHKGQCRLATVLAVVFAVVAVSASPAAAADGRQAPGGPAACPASVASAALAAARARSCGQAVEVLAQRSQTSRTFANPDGTYRLEVSAVPRRVHRPDGSWADIDTSLRRAVDGSLAPVTAAVPVRLSAGGTGPVVTASTGPGSFSLSWPAPLPAPRIDGDAAVYADVFPGVDLRVRALPTGFTYVLVVRTRAALVGAALRRIPMRVSGLALRQLADGSVAAVTAAGSTALSAGGALMWDSNGGVGSSPDGPGDQARSAPVTTTVSGGDLVLTPDPAMLTADVSLPVYIDPQISGQNRWAYADSTNANRNDGVARVGVNPDGSGLYRTFFEFNTAPVIGTHVIAATFNTVLTHSWSCGNTPVSLYYTGGITAGVNGTRVGWSPALNQWLDERSSHAHKPDGGAGCAGDPQPDQPMQFSNLLTGKVQEWANSGTGTVTLGLSAMSGNGTGESTTDRWKKFWVAGTNLTILYNSLPATPGSGALSTVGTSQRVVCYTGAVAGQPAVNATNGVQLSATLTDNDGGDIVVARYEWQDVTAGTAVTVLADSPGFTTPHPYSVGLPAASLVNGHSIRWRVHGWDGTDNGGTSAWCEFAIDNSTPGQPTLTSTDLPPFPNSPPAGATVGVPGSVTVNPAANDSDVVGYFYGVGAADPVPTVWLPARAGGVVTIPVIPVVSGLNKNFLSVVAVDAAGNRSPVAISAADAPGTRQFLARAATPPGVHHDVTGDRTADFPVVEDTGDGASKVLTFVSSSDGSTVFDPTMSIVNAAGAFPASRTLPLLGDFTGDGRGDIAMFRDDGGCRTSLWWWTSTGNGYAPGNAAVWDSGAGAWCFGNSTKSVVGDFNGDGRADIGAFYDYGNAEVKLIVFLTNATGTGVASVTVWWDSGPGNWEYSHMKTAAGDFDGDGRTDIGAFYDYNSCAAGMWVFTSTGAAVTPHFTWSVPSPNWCFASTTQVLVGDVNGDGKDDFNAIYDYGGGNWRIWTFFGPGLGASVWTGNNSGPSNATSMKAVMGDFNGDGRADLAHFYNGGTGRTNLWVLYSTGSAFGGENLRWDSISVPGGLSWSALRPL